MSVVLDLSDLAASQWGLFTSAQARELGAPPQTLARLANQGALERLTHGVYRVTGAPSEPLDALRAAWLALDPAQTAARRVRAAAPAVVSHRSAAEVHQLGDIEADDFEFITRERKQSRRSDVRLHRGEVKADEWTVIDALPVTTVLRTVDDLAAARIDGGHLAGVVRDALTRHQVDDEKLIAILRRHAHHYGAPLGDGEALLSRMLQESGVPQPLEVAVGLGSKSYQAAWRLNQSIAKVEQAMSPLAKLAQDLAESPTMRAAKQTAELLQAYANTPAMRAAAEAAERLQSSPGMRELARQQAALVQSPAMRAMADFAESPTFRAMADLARSPALQAMARSAEGATSIDLLRKYAEVASFAREADAIRSADLRPAHELASRTSSRDATEATDDIEPDNSQDATNSRQALEDEQRGPGDQARARGETDEEMTR